MPIVFPGDFINVIFALPFGKIPKISKNSIQGD